MSYYHESFVSRHIVGIIAIVASVLLLVVFIPILHDGFVQQDKSMQIIKNIREKESCSELKSDIDFIGQMNQGLWIKQFDDSDVQKYYKEKNCS